MDKVKKITEEEYEKIENLVNMALDALTRQDAEEFMSELKSTGNRLTDNTGNMFSQLLSYMECAVGRVPNERKQCARQELYKFRLFAVE